MYNHTDCRTTYLTCLHWREPSNWYHFFRRMVILKKKVKVDIIGLSKHHCTALSLLSTASYHPPYIWEYFAPSMKEKLNLMSTLTTLTPREHVEKRQLSVANVVATLLTSAYLHVNAKAYNVAGMVLITQPFLMLLMRIWVKSRRQLFYLNTRETS